MNQATVRVVYGIRVSTLEKETERRIYQQYPQNIWDIDGEEVPSWIIGVEILSLQNTQSNTDRAIAMTQPLGLLQMVDPVQKLCEELQIPWKPVWQLMLGTY
jgi:hypothetical protein